jgi:hypothetical protein
LYLLNLTKMDYFKRTFLGKDDRDFMHAVVPLHSDRHMTEVKTDGASIGEKSTHSQNSSKSTTTLESLRAEVDSVDAEGHNTAYDRTYTLAAGETFSIP